MTSLQRSPLHAAVFATALTAAALILTLLIRPLIEPNIFLLFLVAAWMSARYYGRIGGLTSTAASALVILYFFLRPDPSETTPSWNILARLIAFIALGSLMTWVTASLHASQRLLNATLSSIGDAVLAAD